MDTVQSIALIFGTAGALLGIYTAIANLRSGQSHAIIERAQFLEEEVTKLSKENDELLKDKIALERENNRLRGLLARRTTK